MEAVIQREGLQNDFSESLKCVVNDSTIYTDAFETVQNTAAMCGLSKAKENLLESLQKYS